MPTEMMNKTDGIVLQNLQDNERRILFLSAGATDSENIEKIRAADWKVDLAETTAAAEALLSKTDYYVAVISLTDELCEDIGKVNRLMSRHLISWFSIVTPKMLQNAKVCRLLATHCHDFHTRPVDGSALAANIGHAYGMRKLSSNTSPIDLNGDKAHSRQMIGTSRQMEDFMRYIGKAARVNAPVLISGENGTGKQLSAVIIHEKSNRSNGRFIAVNCGAGSEETLAKNLYGSETVTHAGTREVKMGGIEAANGGTLFLSNIEQLPESLQITLLNFIETTSFQRVGGQIKVDATPRIITSSTVDLEQWVEEGKFREDLFYTLRVLHLKTTSLRDRVGDIELLAEHFLAKYQREATSRVRGFAHQALTAMHRYHWPGNVKELENRIRQALLTCEMHLIQPADLELDSRDQVGDILSLEEARIRAEGEYIRTVLHRNYHNVTETAQQLGVSRVTLYRLMKKYSIDIVSERQKEITS